MRAVCALLVMLPGLCAGETRSEYQALAEARILQLQREVSSRTVELGPWMARLKEGYSSAEPASELKRRHDALSEEVRLRIDELSAVGEEYDRARAIDAVKGFDALNAAGRGQPPLSADRGLELATRRQIFSDGLWNYVNQVHAQLALEESAYRAAHTESSARERSRRRWKLTLAALAAAAALSAAAFRLGWRRPG